MCVRLYACTCNGIFLQSMAEILSPFGHVVALEANSSNIISVIQDTFNV